MNSNDHSSFYNRQPRLPHSSHPPRPFVQEDTLKTEMIQIERKAFVLTLKENLRGRFLRITEAVGEKRSTIIIPSTGLAEFKKLLLEQQEQVMRALASNLVTYGTGAGIQFADRDAIDGIAKQAKADGSGLRSLVHAVVQSPLFLSK